MIPGRIESADLFIRHMNSLTLSTDPTHETRVLSTEEESTYSAALQVLREYWQGDTQFDFHPVALSARASR